MGKDKLRKFAENLTFTNMIQPEFEEVFRKDHKLKGEWHKEIFKNDNPIVVELGCGKGEYSVALAKRFPEKNFIGVDIKGARMWRGAKTGTEKGLNNLAFLRTRIEFINSLFGENEVSEIWITFPDPQSKKQRVHKRLTSAQFLDRYAKMITAEGKIHLKTDSKFLHYYTLATLAHNNIEPEVANNDIYKDDWADEILSIKTAYERFFAAKGETITYLRFSLGGKTTFTESDFDE